MLTSQMTAKFLATVPQKVRDFLKLSTGDLIIFEIKNNSVVITKAGQSEIEFIQTIQFALSGWNSEKDNVANKDL